jgi:predicted transcriptional regulator
VKWLGLGAALALALIYAAWSVQVSDLRASHASVLAAEQKRTADGRAAFDAYKLQVEQIAADTERNRAASINQVLDKVSELQAENERLRGAATAAERRRADLARELLRMLDNAAPSETSRLGTAVLRYLDRVRVEQRAAAGAASGSPAAGNPD